jgi:hypothetical protein
MILSAGPGRKPTRTHSKVVAFDAHVNIPSVRLRVLFVLAAFVLADAVGIGLLLSRQGPETAQDALTQCQSQVRSTDPRELGPCLRQKVSRRDVGTSRGVILVPLVLGAGAIVGIGIVLRAGVRAGEACPVCGAEVTAEDAACGACGYPLTDPTPEP